jgi:hypothetical protein
LRDHQKCLAEGVVVFGSPALTAILFQSGQDLPVPVARLVS